MEVKLRREQATKLVADVLPKVKWARYYAADPAVLMALGATVAVWHAKEGKDLTHANVAKFLERLRPFVPSLFQQRPGEETEPIDLEKYRDPVSKQLPPNPWAKDSLNLSEQAWLQEHEPRLAEFLKATGEAGLSYSYLARQKSEEQRRAAMRDLEYTEEEHKTNPFRGRNLSLQNGFYQTLGKDVADFYRREATTEIEMPWLGEKPNITLMGRLQREAPDLHSFAKESVTVARGWAENLLTEAKAQRTSAESILRSETGQPFSLLRKEAI
jgi:hypothetical protein